MAIGRRSARELALKTIFQVDVGKQPLSEVLEAGLEQFRWSVRASLAEYASVAKSTILEQALPPNPDLPNQSKRMLRGIARALVGEIQALEDRAADICRETVAESGHFDHERAIDDFSRACDQAETRIRARADRSMLYAAHVETLRQIALDAIPPMREHFGKVIETTIRSAMFAVRLVHGATEKRAEIDRRVAELSSGWALDRQAAVDRNILRLGAYELLYVDDVPAAAAINEAVELARKFSTEESGRFVNGVLGALASALTPTR